VQESLIKHVWFLTIMTNINTRQRVATNHHIWFLTSKLTKKTVNITTYFVIADFVVNNVLLWRQTGFRELKCKVWIKVDYVYYTGAHLLTLCVVIIIMLNVDPKYINVITT